MLIIAVLIVADYFALFGIKTTLKLDFVEARFRTVDAETGQLIMNVGVRCFQKNNSDACTRRENARAGVVSVHIPVKRVLQESLLFRQSAELIKSADPKIHVMLMHQNYNNPTKTLLLSEVYANGVNEYQIEMPPRAWADQQYDIEEINE